MTRSRQRQLEQDQAFVFHVEDERVQSVWLLNYDTREADEFWSDRPGERLGGDEAGDRDNG